MVEEPRTRLGLSLSGGGFRAALFHIGALAALAERELLHKVEVISTVSGGSIIGACYCLKVKRLLEGNMPGYPLPGPEAYHQIVRELEQDFLAAVQKNLRLFSNPWKNWRMAREDYSRTHRLAELLDAHLFAPIAGYMGSRLKDVHIYPSAQLMHETRTAGGMSLGDLVPMPAPGRFDVELYNRHAEYKVPLLVINATCLNTGHPWHFTGAYVGSLAPRRAFAREVDTNVRLPPLRFDGIYHDDRKLPQDRQRRLSERQRLSLDRLTLAEAVAASAAVPGIFPPLALPNLYTNSNGEEIVVQLTDGGVFDNQGVEALLQHRCTHAIVSDASGQLEDERILGTGLPLVIQRANDIMMDTIRGETLYRLHAGCEASRAFRGCLQPQPRSVEENALDAYVLIHLRQTFANSAQRPAFPGPVNRPEGTVYRLSNLRTDLDSFSDAEAYALMYDAYCLLDERLGQGALAPLPGAAQPTQVDWRFLAIAECLCDRHRLAWLHRRLKAGKALFFRAFRLRPLSSGAIAAAMLLALSYTAWWGMCQVLLPARAPGAAPYTAGLCSPAQSVSFEVSLSLQTVLLALLAAGLAVLPVSGTLRQTLQRLGPLRRLRPVAWDWIAGIALAVALTLSAVVLWTYRQIFDRIFLYDGRLARGKCRPSALLARLRDYLPIWSRRTDRSSADRRSCGSNR